MERGARLREGPRRILDLAAVASLDRGMESEDASVDHDYRMHEKELWEDSHKNPESGDSQEGDEMGDKRYIGGDNLEGATITIQVGKDDGDTTEAGESDEDEETETPPPPPTPPPKPPPTPPEQPQPEPKPPEKSLASKVAPYVLTAAATTALLATGYYGGRMLNGSEPAPPPVAEKPEDPKDEDTDSVNLVKIGVGD